MVFSDFPLINTIKFENVGRSQTSFKQLSWPVHYMLTRLGNYLVDFHLTPTPSLDSVQVALNLDKAAP